MNDLKLKEWQLISSLSDDQSLRKLAETKTPALVRDVQAFVENVARMAWLSRFPGELFIGGVLLPLHTPQNRRENAQSVNKRPSDFRGFRPVQWEQDTTCLSPVASFNGNSTHR